MIHLVPIIVNYVAQLFFINRVNILWNIKKPFHSQLEDICTPWYLNAKSKCICIYTSIKKVYGNEPSAAFLQDTRFKFWIEWLLRSKINTLSSHTFKTRVVGAFKYAACTALVFEYMLLWVCTLKVSRNKRRKYHCTCLFDDIDDWCIGVANNTISESCVVKPCKPM